MPKLWRRLKIFIYNNRVAIIITFTIIILLILSVWGLYTMESFYRNLTLAGLPITILSVFLQAFIFAYLYMNMMMGGFNQMKRNKIKADFVNVKFDQVIGIDEAKDEAWEMVQLIKDRTKLKQIGGRILRGMLLIGPPGCGKTLLAKAIATEAGLPFLSISGSEFVEIFVGVGASRVRKLFAKAKKLAYAEGGCIIFIDELDAVGRRRSFSFGGGQETDSTLNQLLIELDGLEGAGNIVVMGATNAIEGIMDEALLRPGRFDRKIFISKPGLRGREKLFRFYLDKVKHDPTIDIGRLARKSVGKSPAEVENVIKESALIATRNKREVVTYKDLTEAIERIDLGIKLKREMTSDERERVAFHEAGHLIVLYILHPTDDVFKASIATRQSTLGVVYHQPREEYFTENKDGLLADIKVSLGGYLGEKIRYGVTSNGVASDFRNAMHVAHSMVWKFGMGKQEYVGDYTVIPETEISDKIKDDLNADTREILNACLKEAEDLLRKEKHILERFAKELLEKTELEYDDIEAIFKEYGYDHQVTPKTTSAI